MTACTRAGSMAARCAALSIWAEKGLSANLDDADFSSPDPGERVKIFPPAYRKATVSLSLSRYAVDESSAKESVAITLVEAQIISAMKAPERIVVCTG